LVLLGLATTACVSQQQYDKLRNEHELQTKVLRDLQVDYENLQSRNAQLEGDLAKLNLDLQKSLASRDDARNKITELKQQLDEAIKNAQGEQKPWEIVASPGEGAFSYRIEDTLLFAKGSAKISPEGRKVIQKLARELKKHDFEIQIEGHTDIDPVKVHVEDYPLGNPQLAAMRALNVLAELRKAGIPEGRLSLAAYGPNRPVVSGTSEDAKRQNRRVDVKVFVGKTAGTARGT
jgi:flagellar motor protein MotB